MRQRSAKSVQLPDDQAIGKRKLMAAYRVGSA
jgi:hypothetical protein